MFYAAAGSPSYEIESSHIQENACFRGILGFRRPKFVKLVKEMLWVKI